MKSAEDTLHNVGGLAHQARRGLLDMLCILAPECHGADRRDLDDLEPLFSALSAVDCIISESTTVIGDDTDERESEVRS